MNAEDLLAFIEKQFNLQSRMLPLYQTLADNFYPERADFTYSHNVGEEIADNLLSSYPVMMRRDLGNAIGAMLRDGEWFNINVDGDADHMGKAWLQWATQRQRRFMYHQSTNFVRATREGDHDYSTFGQLVMSVEPNRKYDGMLFRTWHLRDCCWWEDETGVVCGVARKWKPTRRMLINYFGEDKLHTNMLKELQKNQLQEEDIRHVQIPVDQYGHDSPRKYAMVFVDVKNKHIIEEVFTDRKMYAVPRFQTVSGSPYAYSPAAITALPDARMIQAMTHTLMEAGERYARPPLIAQGGKIIQSAVDLGSDGITYLDPEYDERNGPGLRPLNQDRGGFPIGLELRDSVIEILASAWYVNKLALPEVTRDMTAYEVQERMKQYRRENLPLFAPIEYEYNGQICEMAFDLGMEMGMFGSPADIPDSLQEKDVIFKFESPLTESEEEKKMNRFRQVADALASVAEQDPSVRHNMNFDEAFRDAVQGMGAPEKWLTSMDYVVQARQAEQEAAIDAQQQQG